MKMTFPWQGQADPVSLSQISQIPGVQGIAASLSHIAVGQVWPTADILDLQARAGSHGLSLHVIENLPVHEDIKLGRYSRQGLIDQFITTLTHLAQCGIEVVTYNFTPMSEWSTSVQRRLQPQHATEAACEATRATCPLTEQGVPAGCVASQLPAQIEALQNAWYAISPTGLWRNLLFFLQRVVPAAEALGIKLALHADAAEYIRPAVPLALSSPEELLRAITAVNSPANGLALRCGGPAAPRVHDLLELVREFGPRQRIHYLHLGAPADAMAACADAPESARSLRARWSALGKVLQACRAVGYQGFVRPGYGLVSQQAVDEFRLGMSERALGAAYFEGLWDGIYQQAATDGKLHP
ncbi:mannonate dehydratase [Silvimonas sp. JCM 19000]